MNDLEWLVKKHEASLTPFGIYPGARFLKEHIKNGIIVIDKTSGPTRAFSSGEFSSG